MSDSNGPPTEDDFDGASAGGSDETIENEPAPVATHSESDVIERVAAAQAEAKERYLRLAAEYDNFRRRVQREKEQWNAEAIERFSTDLLDVLDDFDRALAAKTKDGAAVLEGVKLTDKKLRAVLAKHGVETIDPSGKPFDPRQHEAIQRVPAGPGVAAGSVATVFEKGYVLKGKLLRPARVVVAGDK